MLRKAFLSLLLVAGLVLVSCGGATPAPKPTPTPTPTPTPVPTPAPMPVPGTTTPDTEVKIDAAKLFATNCAACHGPNRQGTPGLAPALTATSLAAKSDADVKNVIAKGKTGTAMAPFEGRLSAAEIDALVKYLKQ